MSSCVKGHKSPATTNTKERTKRLTLAEMRGLVPLFNAHFNKFDAFGNKIVMKRPERNERWITYKEKVWTDYHRAVKGTFESERSLIRRYSHALTFLKYRQKKASHLDPKLLSYEDYEYYIQIGGTDDVSVLYEQERNVDSLAKMQRKRPRKKHRKNDDPCASLLQTGWSNDNRAPELEQGSVCGTMSQMSVSNAPSMSLLSLPPHMPLAQTARDSKATIKTLSYPAALDKVQGALDVHEQNLLLKKRIEAYEITQENCRALTSCVQRLVTKQPEMIGMIPGLGCREDQLKGSFEYWINQNEELILKNDSAFDSFKRQLRAKRADPLQYISFLDDWKMQRLVGLDDAATVWAWIKDELNVVTASDEEIIFDL